MGLGCDRKALTRAERNRLEIKDTAVISSVPFPSSSLVPFVPLHFGLVYSSHMMDEGGTNVTK